MLDSTAPDAQPSEAMCYSALRVQELEVSALEEAANFGVARKSIFYSGAVVCFLHVSFNLAQALQTQLHPADGSLSVVILYVCYVAAGTVASSAEGFVGIKKGMMISASTYCLCVFASIFQPLAPRVIASGE
jgi:hypothetical protein